MIFAFKHTYFTCKSRTPCVGAHGKAEAAFTYCFIRNAENKGVYIFLLYCITGIYAYIAYFEYTFAFVRNRGYGYIVYFIYSERNLEVLTGKGNVASHHCALYHARGSGEIIDSRGHLRITAFRCYRRIDENTAYDKSQSYKGNDYFFHIVSNPPNGIIFTIRYFDEMEHMTFICKNN